MMYLHVPLRAPARWYLIYEDALDDFRAYADPHGTLKPDELASYYLESIHGGGVVDIVDDGTDLSLVDALSIADTYGGGELDGEAGGVVLALITLRDHIKAGQ